ncbi:MAG: hypothetical protein WBM24_01355 [Candidatus Sulfotelmatobacter sp.]
MGEKNRGRNAEAEDNPENRALPRQMEVSGKEEQKKNKPTLNHAHASAQNAGCRNEPERRRIRKGGNDRGGKYENDTNTADQYFPHPAQGSIATQEVSENLANNNELYERFNY